MAAPKQSKATVKGANKIPPVRDPAPPELAKVEPGDLPPEEWDFRKIHSRQLDAAILYEYARSSDWMRGVFKRWHQKTLRPRIRSASLGKWAGRNLGEILRQHDVEELPPEVRDWLTENMPLEFGARDSLTSVWRISLEFPKPFLKLVKADTEHVDQRRNQDCPAFWAVKPGVANPPGAWLLNSPPVPSDMLGDETHEDLSFLCQFRGVIDLRFSKTAIKECFGRWIDNVDDSKVQKLKLGKGKAASLPWFRLKELAAYRLAKLTTMKHVNARGFVQDYLKKKKQKADDHLVLPNYTPSGFSDAIKSAEQYLQTLFPKP